MYLYLSIYSKPPIQSNAQKTVKCKNLSELFANAGKADMKNFYDKEILDYKREYSKWFD